MAESKFGSFSSENVTQLKGDLDWSSIDANGSILHLTSGLDANGREYYAYMFIQPSKYQEFLENAERAKSFNLEDFGLVIESGFGSLPPKDVQKKMEEEYFFNHEYEDLLLGRSH